MQKLLLPILLVITLCGGFIASDTEGGRELILERLESELFDENYYLVVLSIPTYLETQTLGSLNDCPFCHLLEKYDWNYLDAKKIMLCESGGNSNANNFNHTTRDNSWGLFQINLYGRLASNRPSAEWLKIPENNVEYAYNIYLQEGRRFGTTGGWFNCAKENNIW